MHTGVCCVCAIKLELPLRSTDALKTWWDPLCVCLCVWLGTKIKHPNVQRKSESNIIIVKQLDKTIEVESSWTHTHTQI